MPPSLHHARGRIGPRPTSYVDDKGDLTLFLNRSALVDGDSGFDVVVQSDKDVAGQTVKLIIDGRDGTIIAGGDLTVGEATVSHGGVTLTIGVNDTTAAPANAVRMAPGKNKRIVINLK